MDLRVRQLYKKLVSIARQLPPGAVPMGGISNRIKMAFRVPITQNKGVLEAALERGKVFEDDYL